MFCLPEQRGLNLQELVWGASRKLNNQTGKISTKQHQGPTLRWCVGRLGSSQNESLEMERIIKYRTVGEEWEWVTSSCWAGMQSGNKRRGHSEFGSLTGSKAGSTCKKRIKLDTAGWIDKYILVCLILACLKQPFVADLWEEACKCEILFETSEKLVCNSGLMKECFKVSRADFKGIWGTGTFCVQRWTLVKLLKGQTLCFPAPNCLGPLLAKLTSLALLMAAQLCVKEQDIILE